MIFIFYKQRLPGGHNGPWRAMPEPFATLTDAETMVEELLSYRATAGQQEYAAAKAIKVKL